MDAVELMRLMSAQAAHDNPVPKTKLGFIDYDFDPSTYPQVLPRVIIDGQGMSDRGYQCLSSYNPIPGDRVLMVPVGIALVIIGAIDRTDRSRLLPGTYVFAVGKENSTNQTLSGSTDYVSIIFDTEYRDLVGGWSVDTNPTRFTPQVPGWYKMSGQIRINDLSSNGQVTSLWLKNGLAVEASRIELPVISGHHISMPASNITVYLNGTTDYLELQGRSSVATTIDSVTTSSFSCRMEAIYAGDDNKELYRLDRT